jgi:hypothetical protein
VSTSLSNHGKFFYCVKDALGGLKLTREAPPGECGRKVKLKGIDGGLYKGWRCGLIRITRKTLPIFVSGCKSITVPEKYVCGANFIR